MARVFRCVTFLTLLIACAGADAPPVLTDTESLAELMRARLPSGWTISVKNESVVLDRKEPVELYNGLSLPRPGPLRDEMIKRSLRREKLTITMWVGKHVTAEEFKKSEQIYHVALKQARKDLDDGKASPDAKFWKEHPEYGYRLEPIPILDADRVSIYMIDNQGCISRPTAEPRPGGHVIAFFDERVEKECQGLIDDLGKLYRPY